MSDSLSNQPERLEHRPTMFVGIVPSGTLVYVGIAKRDEFDALQLPVTDHGENDDGHLLSKSLETDGVRVLFQYWLKSRTYEALSADLAAERAARASNGQRASESGAAA